MLVSQFVITLHQNIRNDNEKRGNSKEIPTNYINYVNNPMTIQFFSFRAVVEDIIKYYLVKD